MSNTYRIRLITVSIVAGGLLGMAAPLSPASAAVCTQSDPIEARYCQLGGVRSFLGAAKGTSYFVSNGRARDYAGGTIYWSSSTGAKSMRGVILGKYKAMGGPFSLLRFPTTDETGTPDAVGRFNHFAGGSIYWTPSIGAHEIHGLIRTKWSQLGWERSVLGYPTSDELVPGTPSGRYETFSKAGSIYWSPLSGANEVHGAIRAAWLASGADTGRLGFPTSGEFAVSGGRRNNYMHGTMTYTWSTGRAVASADPHEYWPAEPLTSAAAFQRAFNRFHTNYWSGGDGAGPITLPDGRHALMFGDTMRGAQLSNGAFAASLPMVSNSLVTVDDQRFRALPGPTGGAFIPDGRDGARYWPIGGYSVGNRMWMICTRSFPSTAGFGFRLAGTSLAAFDVPTGGDPVFRGMYAMPGAPYDSAGNQIGVAWNGGVRVENGTAYVFGARGRVGAFGNDMYLASVPAEQIATPSSWRYWTGSGWSTNAATAAQLIKRTDTGVPGSFGVTTTPNGYVIDGKANGIMSPGISTWTAPALTGPWTQVPDVLPRFPTPLATDEFTYGGYRLADFPLASGRALMAYSRNNFSWSRLTANANYYMPQFLEVDAPKPPDDPVVPPVDPPPTT